MSEMIREHELGDNGRCKHCGTVTVNNPERTCLLRAVEGGALRPEPARRQYASEDWDGIAERIAELRREREAALNEPELPIAGRALGAEDICYG